MMPTGYYRNKDEVENTDPLFQRKLYKYSRKSTIQSKLMHSNISDLIYEHQYFGSLEEFG